MLRSNRSVLAGFLCCLALVSCGGQADLDPEGPADAAPPPPDARTGEDPHEVIAGACELGWMAAGAPGQVLGSSAVAVPGADEGRSGLAILRSREVDGAAFTDVQLLSAATGAELAVLALEGMSFALAALPDLDGDGVGELALGLRPTSQGPDDGGAIEPGPTGDGELVVISGADRAVLWRRAGAAGESDFGGRAAAIPDRDGDGVAEILTGSGPILDQPGRLLVLSGADGEELESLPTPTGAGYLYGSAAIAAGPDVDGDGLADLLVGDPSAAGFAGALFALSAADGSVLWRAEGQVQGSDPDLLGQAALVLGDLTDDGIADVAVSAHQHLVSLEAAGRVLALDGRTGAVLWTRDAWRADALGVSLDAAGDVDADGAPDLLVGAPAPGFPVMYTGLGGAFAVLSGRTGAVVVEVRELVAEDALSRGLGHAVVGLGDVRGDDRIEVAATAPGAGEGGVLGVWSCRP